MFPPAVRFAFFSTILACGASIATAQTPAAGSLWEGEVTGTNVYVRSGAGSNWYPTTKLDLGSRVLVLD